MGRKRKGMETTQAKRESTGAEREENPQFLFKLPLSLGTQFIFWPLLLLFPFHLVPAANLSAHVCSSSFKPCCFCFLLFRPFRKQDMRFCQKRGVQSHAFATLKGPSHETFRACTKRMYGSTLYWSGREGLFLIISLSYSIVDHYCNVFC